MKHKCNSLCCELPWWLTDTNTSQTLAAMADATSVPPGMATGPSSASGFGPPPAACLAARCARLASSSSFCDINRRWHVSSVLES